MFDPLEVEEASLNPSLIKSVRSLFYSLALYPSRPVIILIRMAAFPKKITIMACLFLLAVVSIAAYTKYTDDLAKKTTANSFFGDVFPILTSEPTTNMTAIQIVIANASRPIGQPTSDGHELLNSTTTPQIADSNVTLGVPPAIDLGVPKKAYNEFTAALPATSHILLPDKLPMGLTANQCPRQ